MNDFRDYNEYLMHYGVKGMHWGIRRYQPYPDGSKHRSRKAGGMGLLDRMQSEETKKKYVEKNKAKILKSPRKTMQYYDYLTKEEINKARQYKNDKRDFAVKGLGATLVAAMAAAVTAAVIETTKDATKSALKGAIKAAAEKMKNQTKQTFNRAPAFAFMDDYYKGTAVVKDLSDVQIKDLYDTFAHFNQ